MSTRPVSSVRCGRPGLRVSAVRCPASGVRGPVGRPGIWAFGVRYMGVPCLLCPNRVSSSSAPMQRAATRRGRPGPAWSPARYPHPRPAGRLPELEPDARSWRRPCWASGGIRLDLAVVVEGGWAVARSTAWPTRIGWMRGEDRLSVEATCAAKSALLWQACAARHTPAIAAQSPGNVPVREAFNGPQR
jgi:hypothetical protein